MLPAVYLKILTRGENLPHPLLLLIGPCPLFYPMFSRDIDVRTNVLQAVPVAWSYLVFRVLRFLQAGHHSSRLRDLSMFVF